MQPHSSTELLDVFLHQKWERSLLVLLSVRSILFLLPERSLLFLLLERSLLFFLLVRFVLAFSHGLGGIVSNFISSITPAPPDRRLYVQPAFEEAAFFPIRTSTPGSCR